MTQQVLLADQRKRVFADLSDELKETVAWQLNGDWLESIPVLHRLPPKFLVRVALNMSMAVYAPKEKPPAQRLYVIIKGFCTYGGTTLKTGDHWGQRDMANTKHPLCATAITYLHVNYVATKTILELADSFNDATVLRELKKWMLFQKFREHALDRVKRERKREAWKRDKGNEDFPEDLKEPEFKEKMTIEKRQMAIENRVYKLAHDVDQIKQNINALCTHFNVTMPASTNPGSSARNTTPRTTSQGAAAAHRASIHTRAPLLRQHVTAAVAATRLLRPQPLPLPPVPKAARPAPPG